MELYVKTPKGDMVNVQVMSKDKGEKFLDDNEEYCLYTLHNDLYVMCLLDNSEIHKKDMEKIRGKK